MNKPRWENVLRFGLAAAMLTASGCVSASSRPSEKRPATMERPSRPDPYPKGLELQPPAPKPEAPPDIPRNELPIEPLKR